MDDAKFWFLLVALALFAAGLWMLIGDGTCIVACQSGTEWALLWGGAAALALAVALTSGAGALLAIPMLCILFLAKAVVLGPDHHLFVGMLATGLVLLGLSVALVLAGRAGVRKLAGEAELRARGLKGRALVLGIREVGGGNEMNPMAELELLVEPPAGRATFEVTVRRGVDRLAPPRVEDELPVWIDPQHPRHILVTVPGADDYPAPDELAAFGIAGPRRDRRDRRDRT